MHHDHCLTWPLIKVLGSRVQLRTTMPINGKMNHLLNYAQLPTQSGALVTNHYYNMCTWAIKNWIKTTNILQRGQWENHPNVGRSTPNNVTKIPHHPKHHVIRHEQFLVLTLAIRSGRALLTSNRRAIQWWPTKILLVLPSAPNRLVPNLGQVSLPIHVLASLQ